MRKNFKSMVMRNENDGIVITPDYDEKRIQRNEIN
jgi:hypothetical protein